MPIRFQAPWSSLCPFQTIPFPLKGPLCPWLQATREQMCQEELQSWLLLDQPWLQTLGAPYQVLQSVWQELRALTWPLRSSWQDYRSLCPWLQATREQMCQEELQRWLQLDCERMPPQELLRRLPLDLQRLPQTQLPSQLLLDVQGLPS
jgi:hypothetical protein